MTLAAVIAAMLMLPLLLRTDSGRLPTAPVEPVAQWIADAVVGDSLNVDGSIAAPVTSGVLARGRPVYLSLELENVPARAPLQIRWYGPSGRLLHEQRATLTSGLDRVWYSLPPDKISNAGIYRVEVFSSSISNASREFEVHEPALRRRQL